MKQNTSASSRGAGEDSLGLGKPRRGPAMVWRASARPYVASGAHDEGSMLNRDWSLVSAGAGRGSLAR